MKAYLVYIPNPVKKVLKKMPKNWQEKMIQKLRELETNPYLGVKMNGELSHLRKIKIANYRIIYRVIELKIIIEIMEIASRGNISYDR